MKFAGFPKEGLQFLKKLRKNNKREWFDARKDDYLQYIKAPMEELVGALNFEIAKFAPQHVTEPKKSIYRIYRDTRFSGDKTPYKTHLAMNFPRVGLSKHAAGGFYCSISDEQIEIAGGVYMPEPEGVQAMRAYIAENHAALRKIVTNKKIVELVGELQSEGALKKVPRGFAPDHPAEDFLRRKSWFVYKTFPAEGVVETPEIVPFLIARLKAAAPLVDYVNIPLGALAKKPVDPLFR